MYAASSTRWEFLTFLAAIPDSQDLLFRFDARELNISNNNSVDPWDDEANDNDVTAGDAPTFIDSGVEGLPTVRFNGSSNFLDVPFSAVSQPNHIFLLFKLQSTSSSFETIFDAAGNSRHGFQSDSSGNWLIHGGSQLSGGSANTKPYIGNVLFDGSDSKLDLNQSNEISGDAGSDSMDGFRVGDDSGLNSVHAEVDIVEILGYQTDKTGIESDIESYLDRDTDLL